MPNRVTDSGSSLKNIAQINSQRVRLDVLQERLTTGKRINRPSDDPTSYQDTVRLRTSQTEVEQFKRNAQAADNKLTATDDVLTQYEPLLDRLRSLVSRGLTDTTPQTAKEAIATDIDVLRERILQTANTKYNDEYLLGGTRLNAPPFDPTTGAPAATSTTLQHIQIEPGANAVSIGIMAETVFADASGTIFTDLTAAAAALRGTGDETADRATLNNTMSRLKVYTDLANVTHAKLGASMKNVESVFERLGNDSLSYETRAANLETADFAETAIQLSETNRAFEATLQTTARGRRNLLDFLS